jgi:transposase
MKRYGVLEFNQDFGTEKKCLKLIFETLHSYQCSCGGHYSPLKGRRQYQCSKCRFQIAPTAGTIFHKSETPLTLWFFTIFLFANAKSGYSAKKLERDINVTYKTAWRMLTMIRKALPQSYELLKGDVEMDEGFFGGKVRRIDIKNKPVIIAAVERGGKLRAKVTPDAKARSIYRFLADNINVEKTRLITDASRVYHDAGYKHVHHVINHSKEYVRGDVHINRIEGFWAHVKRSINGTHKVVSKKYLQSYLDGFVFHYNTRRNDRTRFSSLLDELLWPAKEP